MSETPPDGATLVGDQTRPQSMVSPHVSRPSSSGQVDIQSAEKDFHELERKYSRPDASNTQSKSADGSDPEKQINNDDEAPFNLKEYLQSANDKGAAAGIKHKVCVGAEFLCTFFF
jgi:hypothetical protein